MTPPGCLRLPHTATGGIYASPYEPYYRWVVGAAYMPPGEPCVCRHVPGVVKTTPYKPSINDIAAKKRVSAARTDTLLNFVALNYIRLRYNSLISSTFVSRGLPGQQASAKADSARN